MKLKNKLDLCEHCGLPRSRHEACPKCGYTWCDAHYWLDHYLCGMPEPKRPRGMRAAKAEGKERQRPR